MKTCLLILMLCASSQAQGLFVNWSRTKLPSGNVCADSPSPYLIWQGFECTPFDHGPEAWTTNGLGAVNAAYTGTVLAGTQSLRLIGAGGGSQCELKSPLFSAQSELWAYFLFRPVALQTPATGGRSIFTMTDTSGDPGTERWLAWINSDGTISLNSSGGVVTTSGSMSTGTTYYVWFHYNSATGFDVGFSTNGIRPTSGANYVLLTDIFTQQVHAIILGRNVATQTWEFIYDNVLVKTSQIGDNPP